MSCLLYIDSSSWIWVLLAVCKTISNKIIAWLLYRVRFNYLSLINVFSQCENTFIRDKELKLNNIIRTFDGEFTHDNFITPSMWLLAYHVWIVYVYILTCWHVLNWSVEEGCVRGFFRVYFLVFSVRRWRIKPERRGSERKLINVLNVTH